MTAVRKFFFDGLSVGSWLSRTNDFDSIVQSYANSASTFSVRFNLSAPIAGVATPFPVTLVGGKRAWFGMWDSANHANDKNLMAGRVQRWSYSTPADNVHGVVKVTFVTPQQELEDIVEGIVFNPTDHPDDITRVAALFAHAGLAGWDYTTGVSTTPSITYPSGPLYEATTPYEQKSIRYILQDIASDPGQPGYDPSYPVRTRRWWVTGRLTTPATPADGVTYVVNYADATPDAAAYDLKDIVPSGDTTAIAYSGASADVDYSGVIRSIYISGPHQDAHLCTWKNMTNVRPGHGHITKFGGTDGTWDAGAISAQRITGGDWEATAQIQEFYLNHETFQHDDTERLALPSHTGQVPFHWFRAGVADNTIGIRTQLGATRLQTGFAQVGWDCGAAVCILRSHFSVNRVGQAIWWRGTDVDNFFYCVNSGGDYDVYRRESGTDTHLDNLGVTPADNQELKVSILSTPTGGQFQIFVDNVLAVQINDETLNEHATYHGLYVDCDADPTSYEARFYDFQCTDFWADKAFGLTTETSVTDWVDISYGFVFNTNGTVTLNEGGLTYETDDFSYNDKFRVSTALYFDTGSASLQRMIVWDKLAAADIEWETLRTRTTGVAWVDGTSPLYVAFAAKEAGATLNNISLRKMYANLFHADPATYGAVEGEYPANGMMQDANLDTFVKRQQRADAIFEQSARPRILFNCTTFPTTVQPLLGDVVPVTYAPAGWAETPSDTRPSLTVTEVKRNEQSVVITAPNVTTPPTYTLKLSDRDYDVDLGGRRHLLDPKQRTKRPDSKGDLTQSADDPTSFQWPAPTGDENFGDRVAVQVVRVDANAGSGGNAAQPIGYVNPNDTGVHIPVGSLVPGGQYVIRWRSEMEGVPAGDWSQSAAFVAPQQGAYEAPYFALAYIGDGANAITAGYYHIVEVPESGTITGWSIAAQQLATGTAVAATVQVDVERAAAQSFLTTGDAAFINISGTGSPALTAQTVNNGADLSGWTGTTVKAHDRLRFVVPGSPTPTALQVAVTIWLKRERGA